VLDLLGMTNTMVSQAHDAGLVYLIIGQSIFGAFMLWGFVTLGARYETPGQIRFMHAIGIWLSLFMVVGAAFLSIKTAALMWFIYGSLQAERPKTVNSRLTNLRNV